MTTQDNSSVRQLILVVEGTAALGPYWSLLRYKYIDKLLRSFSGNGLGNQKSSGSNIEMALIVFHTHGPHSVQRSPWTADFDIFLKWLSEINFCAGGLGEVAMAEGLTDALTMLVPSQAVTQMAQGIDRQKHCLLVAASNPYPIATPVPRPPCHTSSKRDENSEFQTLQWLADAENVAKAYPQCFVSLSVIVPTQLHKLRSIFNAGQHNPSATDAVLKNIKYSHHLVLLSESLMDACSALSFSGETSVNASTNLIQTDSTSVVMPSVPLESATTADRHSSGQAVDGVMIGYPHTPNRELVAGTVKRLPTNAYLTSASGLPHTISSSFLHCTSQGIPGQYSSSCLSTQQVKSKKDTTHGQDNESRVGNTSQQLRSVTASTTKVSLLNNLSYSCLGSAAIPGASTIGLQTGNAPVGMQFSNLPANRMSSAPIPTPQDVQVTGQSRLRSAGTSVSLVGIGQVDPNVSQNSSDAGISSLDVGQPVSSLDTGINGAQSVPRRVKRRRPPRSQIGQSGLGMNQNVLTPMEPVRISSGAGKMIPKPSVNRSVHLDNLQGLGVGNNSTGNLQFLSTATASQQPLTVQGSYTKVWEVSSLDTGINGAQSVPRRVKRGRPPRSQIGQNILRMNKNVLAPMEPVRISSGAGKIIPKPSLNQLVHLDNLQGLGVGNNSTGNLQFPSTATASQQPVTMQGSYTKVWEVCACSVCPSGQVYPNVSQNSSGAGISSLDVGQPVSSLDTGINGAQSVPRRVKRGRPPRSQIEQSGRGMNQNVLAPMEPVRKMIPGPSLNQSVHLDNLQGLGVGNNSTGNLQFPSTATASQQPVTAQGSYTKVWEGMLGVLKESKSVLICKLEAYQNITSPETLAADWPTSMQILKVIKQEHIQKHYQEKADYLIFKPMSHHKLLVQLSENQLCAIIKLPNQILLLSSSDRRGLMIGMLLPEDTVDLHPQPSQQQQQRQLQLLQQTLGQQQFQQLLQKLQEQRRQQQQQEQEQEQRPQQQQQEQEQQQPQPLAQSQAHNQTRPHLISQGQFQGRGPESMQGSGAQQLQQQGQAQGIPSAIGKPFTQSQPTSQTRPQSITQDPFQGHGPAMPVASSQQQQQLQQQQQIPSSIGQTFAESQPSNQTRPQFISQGRFPRDGPAMPGASSQQQQEQQQQLQPQGIPSAIGQPTKQTRPQFVPQSQLQVHCPAMPGASSQQQ